jgi:hypothetical protein
MLAIAVLNSETKATATTGKPQSQSQKQLQSPIIISAYPSTQNSTNIINRLFSSYTYTYTAGLDVRMLSLRSSAAGAMGIFLFQTLLWILSEALPLRTTVHITDINMNMHRPVLLIYN